MDNGNCIIRAELLYDGKTLKKNQVVVVEGGRIVDIGPSRVKAHLAGIVTPAFIDAHSHIGMERQGEPSGESETDDKLAAISPLNNPLDSIYFDDSAFSDAVDFGVLYSCVVPGSGSIMGGRAMVIRNFAPTRKKALVKDIGYKIALGFNPRSVTDWKGPRPSTRMGAATMLRNHFKAVLAKEETARIKRDLALKEMEKSDRARMNLVRREYDLALTDEDWAVFRLLQGEKMAKVHVHKADDLFFLLDLVKEFPMKVSAEHCCDIDDTGVFDELARREIPLVYGPLGSLDYKVELKNASYKNVTALMGSKAFYGLMTDHPVILSHHLRASLFYFLIQGMAPVDAMALITSRNARISGVSDRLGTIAEGKDASLLVWDRDPFHLSAHPVVVMAEGEILRDRR
jgi:imidazolonepropionase-like amidohydrolase